MPLYPVFLSGLACKLTMVMPSPVLIREHMSNQNVLGRLPIEASSSSHGSSESVSNTTGSEGRFQSNVACWDSDCHVWVVERVALMEWRAAESKDVKGLDDDSSVDREQSGGASSSCSSEPWHSYSSSSCTGSGSLGAADEDDEEPKEAEEDPARKPGLSPKST